MYKLVTILIFLSTIVFTQVDYNAEIQIIFSNNCGACHTSNSSGGLNLSTYQNTMDGGNNGSIIFIVSS